MTRQGSIHKTRQGSRQKTRHDKTTQTDGERCSFDVRGGRARRWSFNVLHTSRKEKERHNVRQDKAADMTRQGSRQKTRQGSRQKKIHDKTTKTEG